MLQNIQYKPNQRKKNIKMWSRIWTRPFACKASAIINWNFITNISLCHQVCDFGHIKESRYPLYSFHSLKQGIVLKNKKFLRISQKYFSRNSWEILRHWPQISGIFWGTEKIPENFWGIFLWKFSRNSQDLVTNCMDFLGN